MKTLTAKDAKYGFGRLIDMARAEPVLVAKHGRPVAVVMSVEEYQRLKSSEDKSLTTSMTAPSTRTEES
jgi:prevent-host-death family protein